jgi:nucleotidyltransferase/DNA polymerase involved in DNA repair
MEQIITAPEVKISSIEGISAGDSATLAEHGIETVEQLASATVDDLSDWLDLSVDEAQELLDMAQAITEARRAHAREQSTGGDEAAEAGGATAETGDGVIAEAGDGVIVEAAEEAAAGATFENSAEEQQEKSAETEENSDEAAVAEG